MTEENLPSAWLAAARDPQISGELELVYAHVAREIERRGPACWASGRCCNFEKTGHRLYVTGLEAAYTVANLDSVRARSGGDGSNDEGTEVPVSGVRSLPLPALTIQHIATARVAGGCPFQSANLCSVHAIKPLGCRVYFCDRSAQDWQRAFTEQALADIRAIHDAHAIPYRYGEWRDMLSMLVTP